MKILVFAHRLDVGGTQVNALELCETLRDRHGHDVVLFATPGPMAEMASAKRLRLIVAPDAEKHPSISRGRALRDAVRSEQPDVVHVWDWPQALDAFYAFPLHRRPPMVFTDMSMVASRLLPKRTPTTFGTQELVDEARAQGRKWVELLMPPVDLQANAPNAVDALTFRNTFGLDEREIIVVTVSRLTAWMKAESLHLTVDAVRRLGKHVPLRFVIVGDGTSRSELERRADAVNAELGRQAIVLTGALIDPRCAYQSADIVVGMGGSALRAMAFAKPVIVVGEHGFAEIFEPSTAAAFHYRGLYGLGRGAADEHKLLSCLKAMIDRREEFNEIGAFGRHFVSENYCLLKAADSLSSLFERTVTAGASIADTTFDAARTAAIIASRALIPDAIRLRISAKVA